MLREQFPVVGVVPILVTGLLPAFLGRAGPGPGSPWGWLCFPFVLQNRGGVCISEPCCRSTADPTGVVVRAAGPAGVVARGAERAERAACLLGAADAGEVGKVSRAACWVLARSVGPGIPPGPPGCAPARDHRAAPLSSQSSRPEQWRGVRQVRGPTPPAGSVPVPLGQQAQRGFGNNIPNNFTVIFFVSLSFAY